MHRVPSRERHKLCFHVDLEQGFKMREDGSWRQLRQEIRKRTEVRIPLPVDKKR